MANIRVDVEFTIKNGTEVSFTAPCDCSEVTGLKVYHQGGSKEFAFTDSHGNVLHGFGNIFAAGAVVKVILDVSKGHAYLQNADTNAYLEEQLASKAPAIEDSTYPGCYYRMVDGEREWINPPFIRGVEYRTTERLDGLVVYAKLFDFGAMPANSSKTVHNVVNGNIFHVDGIVFNADGALFVAFSTTSSINVDFMASHVSVGTTYEFSNCTAYLIVKFLK